MTTTMKALCWKVVFSVVSIVVVHVVSALFLKHLSEDGKGTRGSGHDAAVRGMVTRPTAADDMQRVGGYAAVKDALRCKVIVPLRHPTVFFDAATPSLRPPSGVLLCGPPGTGKTMLARACACEAGVPMMCLTSAALESKWWGESPKLLEAAFRLARTELAPCIVFFDELDGLGRTRTDADQSCVYSFKCELLRNLDGIDATATAHAPVVVMACTNCPKSLDPALARRFPCTVALTPPQAEERRSILEVLHRQERVVDAALLDAVAAATNGLTGSDLKVAFHEAVHHRLWTRGDVLSRLDVGVSDGTALLEALGPLTAEDWNATARVTLSPEKEDETSKNKEEG